MSVAWRRVERGRMLYISGAADSSRHVLARLDALLADAGVGKESLLTARVTLADDSLRGEHDAAWSEWIDPRRAPLTVLRSGRPWREDASVEILVTAAK